MTPHWPGESARQCYQLWCALACRHLLPLQPPLLPSLLHLAICPQLKSLNFSHISSASSRKAGRTPTVPKAQSSRTGGEVVGVVYYKSLDGRPEKGKLSMCRRSSPVGGIIYSTRFRLELWAAVIKMLNALTPTKARTLCTHTRTHTPHTASKTPATTSTLLLIVKQSKKCSILAGAA